VGNTLKFFTQGKKNGKNRIIEVIFIVTLFLPLSAVYNANQYLGFYNGGTAQSKAVPAALKNFQVNDPAFTTFLPVVIRNPLPPPGGVWDTSTWDNCSWGN